MTRRKDSDSPLVGFHCMGSISASVPTVGSCSSAAEKASLNGGSSTSVRASTSSPPAAVELGSSPDVIADKPKGRRLRKNGGVIVIIALSLATLPALAEAKSTLTYTAAKRAAVHRGTQIAGQPVTPKTLIREGARKFFAQVTWTRHDPAGCQGCGYDPDTGTFYDTPTDTSCFMDLNVTLRRHHEHPTVRVQDRSC
jgi:hypothetical protein